MKLNQTEQRILSEIQAKGFCIVSHGIVKHGGRSGPFGMRDSNAVISLVQKGLVRVEKQSHEMDSHRGFTNHIYDSRVVAQ